MWRHVAASSKVKRFMAVALADPRGLGSRLGPVECFWPVRGLGLVGRLGPVGLSGTAALLATVGVLVSAGVLAPVEGIVAPVLAADTTDTAVADSLEGQEPDSTTVTTGPLARKRAEQDFWEAHPSYSMKINKRKDVTNWDSQISLSKDLSDKVNLNLNGNVSIRENTTLNRADANNGTNAILHYRLNNNIGFSTTYNTSVSAFRYDLRRNAPVDRKKNQDVTVSSDLAKKIFNTIDVSVRVLGGTTSNSFASVSNEGRKENLTASVSYAPTAIFRTSATYTGNRLFLNSQVDSGGVAVFAKRDRTFSQNLAFSLSYEVLPRVQLGLDASNNQDQRQHPDPARMQQETEKKSSKNASVTSSFDMFKRVNGDLSVRFSNSESKYEIRDWSNSKSSSAELAASATILPWRGATINLGGQRETSREEYITDLADTANNLHKSLSLKMSQNLGAKTDLSLTALSDLTSVFYDNKEANPTDRDHLNNRISLDASFRPYANITTGLGSEFSEEQSIYVRSEQSANNRRSTRYRVSGSYDVETLYDIGITQTYDIGAVYTLYRYSESSNSLVRNSNISTAFRIPITPAFGLNLNHAYKFQDQGSYSERGREKAYSISAENESNTFTIGLNYRMFRRLNLTVRQSYYLQTNWKYLNGKKVLDYDTQSTELSGRVGFKYDFKERTKFSFSLEQNRNEGSRIGAAFRKYWNVELEASHVF